jgi:hypothetical protein
MPPGVGPSFEFVNDFFRPERVREDHDRYLAAFQRPEDLDRTLMQRAHDVGLFDAQPELAPTFEAWFETWPQEATSQLLRLLAQVVGVPSGDGEPTEPKGVLFVFTLAAPGEPPADVRRADFPTGVSSTGESYPPYIIVIRASHP